MLKRFLILMGFIPFNIVLGIILGFIYSIWLIISLLYWVATGEWNDIGKFISNHVEWYLYIFYNWLRE